VGWWDWWGWWGWWVVFEEPRRDLEVGGWRVVRSVRGGGTPGALVLVAEDGRGPVPVDETVGGRRWPEGDHVGGADG
jgi:hypothetical protein